MVQDTSDFAKEGSDVLGTIGDLNVQQLLDSKSKALLVCHHGDIVQTVKVWQSLEIGLVLDQLFGSSVEQTDVGISSDNFFTAELENQSQHTVGGGMLGSEVDSVVSDFAMLDAVIARLFGGALDLGVLGLGREAVGVASQVEMFVRGNDSRANLLLARVSSESRCCEGSSGERCRRRSQAESPGAGADESVQG